jgi:hypothetical protein
VGRVRWQVKIKIYIFFEQARSDAAIVGMDAQGQIEEVNGLLARGKNPSQLATFGSGGKSRPEGFVGLRIRVRDPSTDPVINVAIV